VQRCAVLYSGVQRCAVLYGGVQRCAEFHLVCR
jgi:hypothetical protein